MSKLIKCFNRFSTLQVVVLGVLIGQGVALIIGSAQEQVRINIRFTDNNAEARNLDSFVAREGCPINSALDAAGQLAQRRACREAAVLRFLAETEKVHEAAAAEQTAGATARAQVDARWQPGVSKPTPTPAPTPAPKGVR
jgi:hypothetical protein